MVFGKFAYVRVERLSTFQQLGYTSAKIYVNKKNKLMMKSLLTLPRYVETHIK